LKELKYEIKPLTFKKRIQKILIIRKKLKEELYTYFRGFRLRTGRELEHTLENMNQTVKSF